jgi:hypothetical protein
MTTFRVRRVRRGDFGAIEKLLEKNGLATAAADRAGMRRFRNVVADLGSDFDVAATRNGILGFVHLTYSRDLLMGNRAHLLALVTDSPEARDALLKSATERAARRHCRDITLSPGPWNATPRDSEPPPGWHWVNGCLRIDLASERGAE